jgi:predicted phosphodiesterase
MVKIVRFIGDIHGHYKPYFELLSFSEMPTVQVGDFGFGFGRHGDADYVDAYFDVIKNNEKDRFIRGNHDSTIEGSVMYVGGALSIDKQWRTEGVDWWENEELTVPRLNDMLSIYEKHKPKIMVTHDFPEFFASTVMIPAVNGSKGFPSRTRSAFDAMYEIHKPDLWIAGHWHKLVNVVVDKTRFICIPELSFIDVDVDL